ALGCSPPPAPRQGAARGTAPRPPCGRARRRPAERSGRGARVENEEVPMGTITTFGSVDARSLEQLERCMEAGGAELGVLCADHHPAYSQPIGAGIAYEEYVSPSG